MGVGNIVGDPLGAGVGTGVGWAVGTGVGCAEGAGVGGSICCVVNASGRWKVAVSARDWKSGRKPALTASACRAALNSSPSSTRNSTWGERGLVGWAGAREQSYEFGCVCMHALVCLP